MAKAKELFEDDAAGELEGSNDPNAENYVDPSVEHVDGEEDEQVDPQKVALGLHPFGIQLIATSRDGTKANVILNVEEAFNLAGNLTGLATFHMHMAIQQQMAQQQQIAEMLAAGSVPEKRTKSGIIVKS